MKAHVAVHGARVSLAAKPAAVGSGKSKLSLRIGEFGWIWVATGLLFAISAVVAPGKTVGEAELWLGNPARFVRRLSDREIEQLHYSAQHYVRLKDKYLGA